MKITLFLFMTFTLELVTNAQDLSFKIFAVDNIGRKDTVYFGYNDSSTLLIDSQLGENNIFGTSFDSLDIRIIQRDSVNYNCLQQNHFAFPSTNLYFPSTFDSKINYKPYKWGPHPHYENFEFSIHATAYPVVLKADFKEIGFLNWSSVFLLDSNCSWSTNSTCRGIHSWQPEDTLFMINSSNYRTLVIQFSGGDGINELFKTHDSWIIYPNPAKSSTQILGRKALNGWINVVDIYGKIIFFQKLQSSSTFLLNTENFESGIYFINYYDSTQKAISVRKMIIE